MRKLTIFVGICMMMWWALTYGTAVYVFTEVQELLSTKMDELIRNLERVLW